MNIIKVGYGNFYPLQSQFKNPLEKLESHLHTPLSYFSILIEHQDFVEFGFTYLSNQAIRKPDLTKINWFAINFQYILKYNCTSQNKYVDLFVGGGVVIGEQFVSVKKNGTENYRNFDISIVPQLELRMKPIKRISAGLVSYFLYDLSNTRWKSFDTNTNSISNNRFSGTMVNLYLGWSYVKI